MVKKNVSHLLRNASVFSRGGLIHTFDLVRKKNPQLALDIRNITAGTPLPKPETLIDNKHTDYFTVNLSSFQVRAIVEILVEYGQTEDKEAGTAVVARTLLDDWMRLAKQMISELPNDKSP